ncbi:hypothetical protein CC85DRAFT_293575 [Cutaneotrichosporon oleaginosum]|uniref:EI24-domain-containing protein n=1 Tax=Cutaneotrichosporon oleaginosum TaxID=879819 RepID=A0A0J0XFK9_9TREE|nr:uncharacterized protein CC85DRAFT_293575 [Cutaneotrichosporon oleaginosum]KLT39857.1 hypothetical protein CC85DRAFT_293575 [Cutaneotrichosporon oleaginosum]TXT05454.1 hypothetical protein COLE_06774 [Cutaneotrichosporon oleaginosum]
MPKPTPKPRPPHLPVPRALLRSHAPSASADPHAADPSDPELRSQVVKLTLINLLSLTLLSLFPLVLSPLFARDAQHDLSTVTATTREVRGWFNALLSWPLFAVCFWVNAIWGPGIARRAQGMMHPSYRHQPLHTGHTTAAPTPTTTDRVWLTLTRLLLIADFTLVARSMALIPVIGRLLSISFISLINSYYAYEWIFVLRQWSLDTRCAYISSRGWYMFGFGLPATLLTSFGPPLINMAIFSLIYPFFVIQALQSRPPSASVLPGGTGAGTPGSGASTPTKETHTFHSPILGGGATTAAATASRVQVPIFFFARHALTGLRWLVEAGARDRGGSTHERALGRRQ